MGAFFESALLFSLAVLIVLVGLLIYYFKGRIGELEQKNMKCLELVGEVYKSHLAFKQEVYGRLSTPVPMPLSSTAPVSEFQDPRIRVEIQEQSDQSDVDESDDESDDSESDQSDVEEPQIKMINVDLSGSLDAEEIEIDDAEEIDLGTEDLDNDEIEIGEVENITVNKMDQIDGEINIVDNAGKSTQDDRESYKKMGLPALRSFIISKGYQTDSAKLQKMKKNELIDLIMESA
jgi:hypothetical protein